MNVGEKKYVVLRAIIGAPIGLTVTIVISILLSLSSGGGEYYAVPPELISDWGSEISAVIVQTILSLAYGAMWGAASAVFGANWSLTKMSLVHLGICVLPTVFVAVVLHWIPANVLGIGIFFAIFFSIYASIWIVNYIMIKRQISKINRMMIEKSSDGNK